MSIDQILAQATSLAVKELYGVEFPAEKIVPQTTKKEFEGNETIVVFPFLKA
jgi:arginyl-tRNA synthetase